jgi:hypothetical protein
VDVVLWGERASSFPAEQIQTDGQASPQVVIFVGTLVKKYFTSGTFSSSTCYSNTSHIGATTAATVLSSSS